MALTVRCCCGLDLKTGVFIVAYANLVVNIILITWTTGIMIVVRTEPVLDAQGAALTWLFMAIYVFYLILYTFNLIFNIILLVGLHKNIRYCVNAYMMFTLFFTVVIIMELFIKISFFHNFTDADTFLSTFVSLSIIAGGCYSVFLVHAYYSKETVEGPVITDAV